MAKAAQVLDADFVAQDIPPTHYDYKAQAWIVGGIVAECGHPYVYDWCFACVHAGESHTCHEECN